MSSISPMEPDSAADSACVGHGDRGDQANRGDQGGRGGHRATGVGDADDHAARVYRHVTGCGEMSSAVLAESELGLSVTELVSAVARLVELHLLRVDGERLVPVAAEAATASLIFPLERALYRQRDLADRLRGRLETVAQAPTHTPAHAAAPVAALDGEAEIRGLFKVTAETCRRELVMLRSNHYDEELLDELLAPCYSVLDREINVRVLCLHRSRTSFASRATATRLMADGARIRTLSRIPHTVVVFDRTLAVPLTFPSPGGQPVARRVRDQHLVQFLVDLFNQLWEDALPFSVAEPGYAGAADDLHRSIVRLMAQGLTDEAVARRLGMSVRTCRRHIAVVLRDLDSVSRFQAGVRAASHFALSGSHDG